MKKIRYIGMAARIVPDKLQNLFVDIIYKNKSFFFKNNIRVLLAGDGILLKSLKLKVKNLELESLVFFSGRLNEESLVKWFKKLDLYVHISKDETTSTSILQAMSMSLPIIASDIGGNRNLVKSIKSVKNMILVKNEVDKIFNKIEFLMINASLRKKMSIVSRKIVVKYFSCETMYRNYQKIF